MGDELFDSTITRLEINNKSLNDAGQIAFIADLADGRVAVVRAEPELVVEPIPEAEQPNVPNVNVPDIQRPQRSALPQYQASWSAATSLHQVTRT